MGAKVTVCYCNFIIINITVILPNKCSARTEYSATTVAHKMIANSSVR